MLRNEKKNMPHSIEYINIKKSIKFFITFFFKDEPFKWKWYHSKRFLIEDQYRGRIFDSKIDSLFVHFTVVLIVNIV